MQKDNLDGCSDGFTDDTRVGFPCSETNRGYLHSRTQIKIQRSTFCFRTIHFQLKNFLRIFLLINKNRLKKMNIPRFWSPVV